MKQKKLCSSIQCCGCNIWNQANYDLEPKVFRITELLGEVDVKNCCFYHLHEFCMILWLSLFFQAPSKVSKKKGAHQKEGILCQVIQAKPWPFHPQMLVSWSHLQPLKWSKVQGHALKARTFTELVSSLRFCFLRKKLHSRGRVLVHVFVWGGGC